MASHYRKEEKREEEGEERSGTKFNAKLTCENTLSQKRATIAKI